MPINKFDGDGFQYAIEHRQETEREKNLQFIVDAFDTLSYWRKKRLMIFFYFCQIKTRLNKACEHVRAVIVPIVEQRPTWGQLYAMSTDEERTAMIVSMLKTIEKRKRRAACHAAIRAKIVPAVMRAVFIFLLCVTCFR